MSQCAQGSLIFWIGLTMTLVAAYVCAAKANRVIEKEDEGGVYNQQNYGTSLDKSVSSWRDWLLVEESQQSSSDTNPGLFVRRITPKSVFVAPSLSGCSEGYRQDSMGRCIKLVKVNKAAQLDFLLQKLNSMYSSSNSQKNKNNDKEISGPFHVSLPILSSESESSDNNYKYKRTNNESEITRSFSTIKPPEEKIKNIHSLLSNSEVGLKKTEFPRNAPVDSPTLNPQQSNKLLDTSNIESTTKIFHEEQDNSPVRSDLNSTLPKKDQSEQPFIIIVANTTHRPFDSTALNIKTDITRSFSLHDSSTEKINRDFQTASSKKTTEVTNNFSALPSNKNSGKIENKILNTGFTVPSTNPKEFFQQQSTTRSTSEKTTDIYQTNRNSNKNIPKPSNTAQGAPFMTNNFYKYIQTRFNYPQLTTASYPLGTTYNPYQRYNYERFPLNRASNIPLSSYSSLNNEYGKVNSYMKVPEQSSSYTSSTYEQKNINANGESGPAIMWYPSTWFQYFLDHRTLSSNNRNQQFQYQPVSNIYQNQFYQPQVSSPSQNNVPLWLNS